MTPQENKEMIEDIREFLGINEDDPHYDEDKILMPNSEENLLKLVESQKKFGGVLAVYERDGADKMIELGYEEKSEITEEMVEDMKNFNKVNYFIGPNYHYDPEQ